MKGGIQSSYGNRMPLHHLKKTFALSQIKDCHHTFGANPEEVFPFHGELEREKFIYTDYAYRLNLEMFKSDMHKIIFKSPSPERWKKGDTTMISYYPEFVSNDGIFRMIFHYPLRLLEKISFEDNEKIIDGMKLKEGFDEDEMKEV